SHRLEQTAPVHVYAYTCEGTIEERIDALLREKQVLFDELVDEVTLDLRAALTGEELFGLFGLEARRAAPRADVAAAGAPPPAGRALERAVRALLEGRGWQVEAAAAGADGGVDLVARRGDELGVETTLYVQCKQQAAPVGVAALRELHGALPGPRVGARGLFVSSGGFTAEARAFARARGLVLWDQRTLEELDGG